MKRYKKIWAIGLALSMGLSCGQRKPTNGQDTGHSALRKPNPITAKEILGNPDYPAIAYGGYRQNSRDIQPTLEELQEDMKILSAMGIKVVRTYNVQLPHASNLLKAISTLQQTTPGFEMYVMLGAWIDCKNAWTGQVPDHHVESEQNAGEIARAVALANQYPGLVKVLAVGNEAMVKWAESYYVQPDVILKWVNHLQSLKKQGQLPASLWITSSDDYASWGGGDSSYHVPSLEKLVKAVDYISMHTYPYHNTHYNPAFWKVPKTEQHLNPVEQADAAMLRAKAFAVAQYHAVAQYVKSVGATTPIHIGETGWATQSDGLYGPNGSKASDEYKQALYYRHMRSWSEKAGVSCFYFEAFNENWKDAHNPRGSENFFGLFDINGKAKYPLWPLVDKGVFKGLTRGGQPITKTYGGDQEALLREVLPPPDLQTQPVLP